MSKLKSFIENPVYFITSPAAKGWLNWVPDNIYIKALYRATIHRQCNLKNPVGYNEKLQWLKLHDRKPEYIQMVDKYEVRRYIAELFGEEYLIPCLGVYESIDDIDVDILPEKFVLKCTHDSGSVEICTNKAVFDWDAAKSHLESSMKRNYYSTYREWPYKTVKPRIIVEQYMIDDESNDLPDFKIMCFNGEARIIEHHENRFTGEVHTQTFYTRDWNILDISQPGLYPVDEPVERPEHLDDMLEMSEKIAKDMYHARIDWYIINGKIYFGEITFYDGSGFEPFTTWEMEEYLGSQIDFGIHSKQ